MSNSALFRHYAQQCIELAEISSESNRDLMLEMANRWQKLADLEQRDAELERTFQPPEPPDRPLNLGPIGGVWRRGGFERAQ